MTKSILATIRYEFKFSLNLWISLVIGELIFLFLYSLASINLSEIFGHILMINWGMAIGTDAFVGFKNGRILRYNAKYSFIAPYSLEKTYFIHSCGALTNLYVPIITTIILYPLIDHSSMDRVGYIDSVPKLIITGVLIKQLITTSTFYSQIRSGRFSGKISSFRSLISGVVDLYDSTVILVLVIILLWTPNHFSLPWLELIILVAFNLILFLRLTGVSKENIELNGIVSEYIRNLLYTWQSQFV